MLEFIQQNTALILIILAGATVFLWLLSFYLFLKLIRLSRKSREFFSGKSGVDLEEIIIGHSKQIRELDGEIQELFEISNRINGLAMQSLHKVGVVRYNPFKDLGGDQSFAVALLDRKNSGLVISSLHTREGTRVYAKPVSGGESKKYPLTEEEKKAIKIASPMKENKV